MDPVKEAFFKIKEDISYLKEELFTLKKNQISSEFLLKEITKINEKIDIFYKKNNPTIPTDNPTIPTDNPTIPTDNQIKNDFKDLKMQKNIISIRNDGVPTNKPTNQQTNKSTDLSLNNILGLHYNKNSFEEASNILNSLDDIKKKIRRTFKNLTNQEMLVFSTLYNFDENKIEEISYKLIADTLNLSESSIRDYINKLINKGILIDKIRINNKKIILKISNKLKEITNLSTIVKLRNI